MKMIEEKQIIRKHSRLIWVFICIYFLIVAGFYLGKSVGERQGLEYRFWVDACFRIWVWFVPILFAGIMILRICIKQWKRKSPWRWILSVLLLVYGCGAVYVSFIYVLVNAFTITSDEKMPDGNLVVATVVSIAQKMAESAGKKSTILRPRQNCRMDPIIILL